MPTDAEPLSLPLVSFVIPMLNEAGAITRCIESILQQDYPADLLEVVVVDGLSQDGSREKVLALAKAHSNVHLYDNPAKRTPISLNTGVRMSKGDVVIILGAHTKIENDFVHWNIHYMRELGVKCVGGTQINTGDTFWQSAIGVGMGSRFGMPSAPYRFYKKKCYVDTVVYAAYARDLFDQVGFFDEELHISEDAEFNWRIRKAGHKIFYTPEIVSYYYPRPNLRRLARQFFNYGILRVNVIKKHPDAVKAVHLVPPVFVLISLISLLAGIVWKGALVFAGLVWVFYLIYLAAASLITSRQIASFRYLAALPAVFLTMQIAWGAGFLAGIFKTYK